MSYHFLTASGAVIEIRTSPDRITWTRIGVVFPDGTPWAIPYNNQTPTYIMVLLCYRLISKSLCGRYLWAPDCTYENGRFTVCILNICPFLRRSHIPSAILCGIQNWKSYCTLIFSSTVRWRFVQFFFLEQSGIFLAKSSTGIPGSWSNEGLITATSEADDYNVRLTSCLMCHILI